ncbi:inositol 1,4,5-trisphosphate receptor-interacting protein-like 1 [Falco biarmicus]|uniref:inositol 1,4,5-trisphosphate receptor-interacting protein-like 1 n=1 Tax=Falco biarmicus TaxID=345155 RepID=UPI0024BC2459|nr:inositol 1,4,5-trisphosphate receptor-interacting protein-like 1 [Falco biarmicus]
MAATFFYWLVVSLIQPQMVGDELDDATHERMQQRAQQLNQEMSRLLQELEQKSGFTWGALLLAARQLFWLRAIAAPLVLCFMLWCCPSKSSHQPESSSKEGSSQNKAHKEDQEEEPSVVLDVASVSTKCPPDLSELSVMLQQLLNNLLCVCQELPRTCFVPRLKPAISVGIALQDWIPHNTYAVYRLLVPLEPPQGHAFHMERGTTEGELLRNPMLRVELKCTCGQEQLLEGALCFIHHPKEELMENQGASLLGTLCTGPYLDMEKTTRWFQILLKAAWQRLPKSEHCSLTVLPSRRSCKVRLMSGSKAALLTEMMFGLQQDDTDIFLIIR